MSAPLLELDGLARRFGARWAVQGLSARLGAGEVVGFLGPNGAGKTTSIKMIAGLLVPTAGRIVLDDIDVAKHPEEAKRRLAYIPDRPYVPERLSARELLGYIAGLYGLDDGVAGERGMHELARFGLKGREDDLLGTYSHGMRQRVLLAAALMRAPRVLLVDEPMVGLDPQGMRLVKRVLREVADGGAVVLMSTHTLDVVEEVCDRVLVMGQGRLVADGTVAELTARLPPTADGGAPTLEDLFILLTGSSDEVSDPGAV
ncbi:MAG: ABC transporter ATP-binding protein [Deltaproteobacteria bacterium]|nr:ABC transporter ATP-binding protein [Deltaproteobacteria bacterium]